MKVVFFEDVEGTALVGDVKDVKNGFARNFLLPRKLAGPPSKDNMQHALALAQKEKRRQERLDAEAVKLSVPLDGFVLTVEARVGETGRLFGSVTNRDVAEKLATARGMEVDSHMVLLAEPIRELGPHPVVIKFTRNVSATVVVDVVPDAESKPAVEKLLAQQEADRVTIAKRAAEEAYLAGQQAEDEAEVAVEN